MLNSFRLERLFTMLLKVFDTNVLYKTSQDELKASTI